MTAAPRVKICGVTRDVDAVACVAAGADYVGLNLWPGSRRHVTIERAAALAGAVRTARPGCEPVALFVDASADAIAQAVAATGIRIVQLHGDEPPARCAEVAARTGAAVWKAIAVRGASDVADLARWPVDAIVLDAPSAGRGGSGHGFDWALARAAVVAHPAVRVILAGGLGPATVATAIAAVGPWAVDVASGVEVAPGEKDPDAIRAFVAAARGG